MTATLSMVPVAQIRPSKANPRAEFDDERMAELIESVKRHGIITPLTLSRDGDGRYAIIAGERRYRAAKAAKLREVPAQVREVEGEALTLAVAENVIRADLSPLEEARAYRRLVDEHGDAAKVAKLVGKSERLVSERLELLRLPGADARAARRPPGAARLRPEPRRDRGARAAARRPHGRMARGAPAGRGGLPGRSRRGRGRRARGRVARRRREAAPSGRLQRRRLPRADPPAVSRPRGGPPGAAGEARPARRGGGRGLPRAPGDQARLRVRLAGPRTGGATRARVLRPQRRRRRRGARLRLPPRTRRGERPRSPLRHRRGVARGSARAEDRRPRRGRGGANSSGRGRHRAVRRRAATTRRRRRDASSGSATTRRGWLPAAATSTSARRSRGGSRSSTPTR